jgi:hypothetical protein
MPKSAATIFGLALVAVSIGFNIWRYPIVWRMTAPSAPPATKTATAAPRPAPAAVEPARSSVATSAVQPIKLPPPKPESATPPLALAGSEAPKPIPGVANSPTADAMATAEQSPSAPDNLEKPLVPIPRMATAAIPIGTPKAAKEMHRLPPVDPNMPTLVGLSSCSSSAGAIPIYPSTGIR